jgi:ribonucleoside-diphosphate reductase alpha chain
VRFVIEQLSLSDNAIKILKKRCLEPGETPCERYLSMADKIASVENDNDKLRWKHRIFDAFAEKRLLPNSPVIMNYGKSHRVQQGSACFVLPIKDDMSDIFDTIRKAALIHKTGGGTGFNFSSLRPAGALVKTTGKPSSGVIPFMKAYDAGTGAVSQGGVRRGANMGILNVNHPDIERFICCKEDNNQINNFNLSVGVTEEFFQAVIEDKPWELYFLDENGEKMWFYDTGDETGTLVQSRWVSARELFDNIVEHAHKNGEPGIIFIDRIQRWNSVPEEVIVASNPCGEQPLPPYNSCVLGSIGLPHVMTGDLDDGRQTIDWAALDHTIETTVRMLDNIVTINEYPISEIKENHNRQRRIGVGFTGLGDVLIMMGLEYASKEGRETAASIMKYINDRGHYYSYMLGKERGNFPAFKDSKYNLNGPYREQAIEFYKSFLPEEEFNWLMESGEDGYMRNAAVSTIAPTGSLTTLMHCESYGCEPLFSPAYMRVILNGEELPCVSALFEKIAKREGFYSEELMYKVARKGSANVDGVPDKWKAIFKNANEISYKEHLMMQSELQKYCDSGISKTINMRSDTTKEDVREAFMMAYSLGNIKGMTVYRDKSRESAPINIGLETQPEIELDEDLDFTDDQMPIYPISRPKTAPGDTTQYHTGCGKTYIVINHDGKSIIETFAFTGSSGGCSGLTEGLSRTISYTLRLSRAFCEELGLNTKIVMDGVLDGLIDQLSSVRCNVALRNKKAEGKSCPAIFAKALVEAQNRHFGETIFQNAPRSWVQQFVSCEDEDGCASCTNREACGLDEGKQIILPDLRKAKLEAAAAAVPGVEYCECGAPMEKLEGCMVCRNCGTSKCN